MNFIVLGHTGFIGAPLYARLIGQGYKVLGLNSSKISMSSQQEFRLKPRTNFSIFEEIKEFISEETIIINCIWGDLSHEKNNSNSHELYRALEFDLICCLHALNFKLYVSFGTIHEVYTSVSVLSGISKYAESKKQIREHLESSNIPFSWIRIASVFGPNDSKFRIIPQLLVDKIHNVDTQLLYPNQQMNIYHIEDFIDSLVVFISSPSTGSYLATSSMWVKLIDIKNAIRRLEEPNYILVSPLSIETDFFQVISVESSSFIHFVKDFIAHNSLNR